MQSTSPRYQELLASTHRMQTQLYIDNVVYGEGKILDGSLQTKTSLFQGDIPTVGGAVSGEIYVSLLGVSSAEVAKKAELRPQVRLVGDSGEPSEWVAQGVYNVDKRSYNKQTGVLTLHGYDKMLATEQWYTGSVGTGGVEDITIVNRICTQVGIELDGETAAFFTASGRSYVIAAPTDYTCRELLQTIAGCYGGNWMMTAVGKLRLVLLDSIPAETNYLVDGVGNAITFGNATTSEEVRILVG